MSSIARNLGAGKGGWSVVGARTSGAAARRSAAAAVVGLLVTALVLLVPSVRFAYRSVEGHLVLETAVTLIGALAALLLYGRFLRGGSLRELLLAEAMAVLAVAALGLVTVPALLGAAPGDPFAAWAALVVRLVGAGLILAAALVPDRKVTAAGSPVRESLVLAALLVWIVVAVALLASRLPDAVSVQPLPESSARPSLDAHPAVLVVQLVNLVCYAGAAVAFTRQSARTGDELVGWLGAAATLGAWARVNYLLFPSLYTEWLYTGDLLRLGFYVLLLVGAVREIQAYWVAQARAAAEGERRRLARDLHDGVVQELGYIRSQALGLGGVDGAPAARIAAAADRALDEARRSLRALTAEPSENLAETLGQASCEVADRYDVPIQLDLDPTVSVPPEHREALVRIAREAVTNAARHGKASALWLTLHPRAMAVRDDGEGFEVAGGGRPGGFGLTSMGERAEAIGAVLRVESEPGRGTEVTVTW